MRSVKIGRKIKRSKVKRSKIKRSRVKRSRVKRSRVKKSKVRRSRVKRSKVKRSKVKRSKIKRKRLSEKQYGGGRIELTIPGGEKIGVDFYREKSLKPPVVQTVNWRSHAYHNGVKVNDYLLEVNGTSVTDMDWSDAFKLLNKTGENTIVFGDELPMVYVPGMRNMIDRLEI